ncbi:MAG TPA: DUF3857 domain-containing protein [Spirochaetes bacterium]|nr:DUF3857 domain-containing protein [Spirochaetota bacterium]
MNKPLPRYTAALVLCSLLALLWARLSPAGTLHTPADADTPERRYFHSKSIDDYETALRALYRWSRDLRDPLALTVNIFRMEELLRSPEMNREALEFAETLEKENPAVRAHPDVQARLDHLRNLLYLRANKPAQAAAMLSRRGYLKSFMLLGPFANDRPHDFDIPRSPEKDYDPALTFTGRHYTVSWVPGETNSRGEIDIGEIEGDAAHALYYFTTLFNAPSDGTYIIHLGKTGYTDLYIDGVRVFSNRLRHGYCADQYRAEVYLPAGARRFMLKSGGASQGIRVSLRVTDSRGEAVKQVSGKSGNAANAGVKTVSVSRFPALEGLVWKKALSDSEARAAAYLLYRSGLNSEERQEAVRLFLKTMENPEWRSYSAYYLGMVENQEDKRLHYFNLCRGSAPGNVECRLRMARLRRASGFYYEAYGLIAEARALNPSAPGWALELAELHISRGWRHEAIKTANQLSANGFHSSAGEVRARVLFLDGRYGAALDEYRSLLAADPFNRPWLVSAVECCEKTGNTASALSLLESHRSFFPRDARLLTTLARLKKAADGERAAIPYVAAAMRISPYNRNLCLLMSTLYRAVGNNDLGLHYLREAHRYDPGDFSLKQYYETITGTSTEVDPLLNPPNDGEISRQSLCYAHEPAIVLLDQYVVRLHHDGSHERWVRKIIKIHNESAIEDFNRQYIVLNPATDRIENIRLAVITDGSTVESSSAYTRSLSDPESRLYYDLQVKIIAAPPIRRGSVIDFSYRLKSNEGRLYRGYFGHSFTAGSEYRTIRTAVIVSSPSSKPLRCHLRGIDKKLLRKRRVEGRNVYYIEIPALAPFAKEPLMPHHSEIRPSVVLSSHSDWGSVYRWYEGLLRDKVVLDAGIKKKLSALIDEKDPPEEKLKKIFIFVSTEIRYVGFELGLGGLEPRSADVTFRSGMGDCKDMSVLLAACLREYGFKASVALVRTRDRGPVDRSIPWLGQFNHALCYVDYGKGVFFDATAKLTGIRELPPGDRDIEAFVVGENSHSFINTGGSFYLDHRETAVTEVQLDERGGALCRRTIIKEGHYAQGARYELLNRQEKLDTISAYWNDRYTGAAIGALTVISGDVDRPVSYTYGLTIPSLVDFQENHGSFRSFLIPSEYYKTMAMMKQRGNDIVMNSPSTSIVEIRYRIPENWRVVRVPPGETRSYPGFSARFSYTVKSATLLEVRSEISFTGYRVGRDDYGRFREFARFIHRKENERIVLDRAPGPEERR